VDVLMMDRRASEFEPPELTQVDPANCQAVRHCEASKNPCLFG
jgi:hypothetical protein